MAWNMINFTAFVTNEANELVTLRNKKISCFSLLVRGEIMRKDALINQLMNQNKMLMASKERQDIEMTAQGETLEVSQTYTDQNLGLVFNFPINTITLDQQLSCVTCLLIREGPPQSSKIIRHSEHNSHAIFTTIFTHMSHSVVKNNSVRVYELLFRLIDIFSFFIMIWAILHI